MFHDSQPLDRFDKLCDIQVAQQLISSFVQQVVFPCLRLPSERPIGAQTEAADKVFQRLCARVARKDSLIHDGMKNAVKLLPLRFHVDHSRPLLFDSHQKTLLEFFVVFVNGRLWINFGPVRRSLLRIFLIWIDFSQTWV